MHLIADNLMLNVLEDVYYKNSSALCMHANVNLHSSLKETISTLFQRSRREVRLKGRRGVVQQQRALPRWCPAAHPSQWKRFPVS